MLQSGIPFFTREVLYEYIPKGKKIWHVGRTECLLSLEDRVARKEGRGGWRYKEKLDKKDIICQEEEFGFYRADFEEALKSVKWG